jgi:selenoprotein W-related protein
LTARALTRFKNDIKRFLLIPSKGGCFELTVNGKLLYSKLKTGEFPDEGKLLDQVEKGFAR